MCKNDLVTDESYILDYLKNDPAHEIANNNLALIYINTRQKSKALNQLDRMRRLGMIVQQDMQNAVNGM